MTSAALPLRSCGGDEYREKPSVQIYNEKFTMQNVLYRCKYVINSSLNSNCHAVIEVVKRCKGGSVFNMHIWLPNKYIEV